LAVLDLGRTLAESQLSPDAVRESLVGEAAAGSDGKPDPYRHLSRSVTHHYFGSSTLRLEDQEPGVEEGLHDLGEAQVRLLGDGLKRFN
jgi:hypothetical protein